MPDSFFESTISFDERGNLIPYQVVDISMITLEKVFNTDFPGSSTRNELLTNFKVLCDLISHQLNHKFTVWVDGSFTTTKVNPNDIDVVFFIDSEDYRIYEVFLRQLVNWEYCQEKKLDCYFVRVYPTNHPNYLKDTDADTKEWLSLFSSTRIQRNGKRYPKGIIQLSF